MTFDSTINFTLDTICPWTYIAKKRIDKALTIVREKNPDVKFTLMYRPYRLFHDAPTVGENKYEWYKKNKYHNSDDMMKKHVTLMTAWGVGDGIDFKFTGTIANTLNAHRVLQHFQETKGPEVADKLLLSLYYQYFEQEQHPSSRETLLTACKSAGIDEAEAVAFIDDNDEGLQDVKMLIQEQEANGIDFVPYIVIEGKRRDITLEGTKEVQEYIKAFDQIAKESS